MKSIINNVDSSFSLTNLTYDSLDRLRTLTGGSGIGSSAISYDGFGNITTYNSKGRNLNYNYNTTTNKLTSVSGYTGKYGSIGYDARGNINSNGADSFVFNRSNQMTSVNNGETLYTYDGQNRRVKEKAGSEIVYSVYTHDGTLLHMESSEGVVNYIYLGGKLIAKDGYVQEAAGKQHSRPFGSSIEGEIDDLGFTGHKFDTNTELSYMQARYYDPVIGRFYSNDPVDAGSYLSQGNTHGFNRYAYANNNPYKFIDPTGMLACEPDSDCKTITETQVESGGATHTGETEDGTPRFLVTAKFSDIVKDMKGGSEMIATMRDAQSDGMVVAGTLVGGVAILLALPVVAQAITSNTLPALTAVSMQTTAMAEVTAFVNAATNATRVESALTAAAPTIVRISTAFIRKPKLPTRKPSIRVDPKTNKPKL